MLSRWAASNDDPIGHGVPGLGALYPVRSTTSSLGEQKVVLPPVIQDGLEMSQRASATAKQEQTFEDQNVVHHPDVAKSPGY